MAQDPFEEFQQRLLNTQDEARDEAVKKRHERGGRTARENLDDLVEGASINEFGQHAVAAQRSRREIEELQRQTAGDGVITAIGPVNGSLFNESVAKTALIINDYTVLAGTQGYFHHRKIDRLLGLAGQQQLPVIMYI